ncbi:cytochrome b/b6 domain-containing protein [Jiangella alkaliphila]|uniref:Formate dehydrogenase subunit gamma n=1 Tax=Jiangella alkaliphila TaxID=419479 RepID=A0A1H2LXB5_9ACTN|nr:cytochrome b/b6 domain-containing protein [Jiangella alkaliphila]SDU85650.1 formate dehydrogenase subunit gamma [Jiangella alkaliphila]
MPETSAARPRPDTVQRYGRAARWLHVWVYLTVLTLLATGWWFVLYGYHRPTLAARLLGQPDMTIHQVAGYLLTAVLLGWAVFGPRGIAAFVRHTLRYRRGDGRWLADWPKAAVTGRFGGHDGHFDPGQRLANIVMVVALLVLVLTGLGLTLLPSDALSGSMLLIHEWSTFALTPVIVGHIIVAAGVLPGYRGVWRSMHLGGRLRTDVAQRLWPGWLREQQDSDEPRR